MKLEKIVLPVLSESQVNIIYSRLGEAPTLYATDGEKVKEVVVKLFSAGFTLFVVEYDPKQKLAFGYMKNEADGSLSEWGYSNVDELLSVGFEMDLYFGEKRISFDGTIH